MSVVKQLAASVGVAYAGLAVQSTQAFWTASASGGRDFRLAMVLVAIPLALTALLAFRLSKEDGAEIAGRPVAAAAPSRRH